MNGHEKYILSPQSINFAPSVNLDRRTSHSPARSLFGIFLMTFGLLHWIELLLYNICHRFLGALFLPELSAEEKNDMLENEFDIKMEGDRKELLKSMCNLSQGIKEQGIEQGRREERISTLVTFFKNDGTVAAAKQMLNSSDEDIKIAKERLSMIEE